MVVTQIPMHYAPSSLAWPGCAHALNSADAKAKGPDAEQTYTQQRFLSVAFYLVYVQG